MSIVQVNEQTMAQLLINLNDQFLQLDQHLEGLKNPKEKQKYDEEEHKKPSSFGWAALVTWWALNFPFKRAEWYYKYHPRFEIENVGVNKEWVNLFVQSLGEIFQITERQIPIQELLTYIAAKCSGNDSIPEGVHDRIKAKTRFAVMEAKPKNDCNEIVIPDHGFGFSPEIAQFALDNLFQQ